jgi:thymidylate synthase (FAD)
MKPQATEFKALVGMNAHALLDWFKIRCCKNAQTEIRDLAMKMMRLCKEAAPALFEEAGPSCVSLGYCPENDFQHPSCTIIRKQDALKLLKQAVPAQ